ncbi:hypothetical protein [Nitrosomonas aestuarii]|nr:hypothetical protein [Nitrosomonas aestuarii]
MTQNTALKKRRGIFEAQHAEITQPKKKLAGYITREVTSDEAPTTKV